MSNLQETPRLRRSDRKRRTTTCEDRVPTPHPLFDKNRPKFSNKYIDPSHSPPPAKKAAYGRSGLIALKQYSSPPTAPPAAEASSSSPVAAAAASPSSLSLAAAIATTSKELPAATTATVTPNDALEILKKDINDVIDGVIERMVTEYEDLRKKILNDIEEMFHGNGSGGNAGGKLVEIFDDEVESKPDKEEEKEKDTAAAKTDDEQEKEDEEEEKEDE